MGYHRSMTDHPPPWPTPEMATIQGLHDDLYARLKRVERRLDRRLTRMLTVLWTILAVLWMAMGLILHGDPPPLP